MKYLIIISIILSTSFITNSKNRELLEDVNLNEQKLPHNFEKVYKSFKKYNKNIDTLTVITFCRVSNAYGFSDNQKTFNLLISQILLESGARHYINNNGNKSVLLSSGGAIGFSQILGSTCLGYMRKSITKKDSIIFKKIGVTDYSFIFDSNLDDKTAWLKAREWLSNEKNNIVMWGKIINDELKTKSILKTLVTYNIGHYKMKQYLNNGDTLDKHEYISNIKRINKKMF